MYLGMQLKFLRIHYFFVTINVAPTEYTVASLRVAISCANSLVLFPSIKVIDANAAKEEFFGFPLRPLVPLNKSTGVSNSCITESPVKRKFLNSESGNSVILKAIGYPKMSQLL